MLNKIKAFTSKIPYKKYYTHKRGVYGLLTALLVVSTVTTVAVINTKPVQEPIVNAEQVYMTSTQEELLPQDINSIKPISEILSTLDGSKSVSGVGISYSDSDLVYFVHFSDGSKSTFNAFSGYLINANAEIADDIQDGDRLPPLFNPAISFAEALTKAKEQNPDAKATKIEASVKASLVLYSVYFSPETIVYISTNSGQIVTLPKSDPIIYTASTNNTTQSTQTSSNNDKKTSWRDKWTNAKNDRRKKLEDYINSYYNRD